MEYNIFIFILFSIILVSSVNGKKGRRANPCKRKNVSNAIRPNKFDSLMLSVSWPPVVCIVAQKMNPKSGCNIRDDKQWTIHGLWPSSYTDWSPSFCNCSIKYNSTELAPMKIDLMTKWRNVMNNSEPESFWDYEWSKHGTCGITIDKLNSQYKYFKKTLELYDKYNMTKILDQANIHPGNNYTHKYIVEAVAKKIGKKIKINCHADLPYYFLSQVSICFDKSFNLTDCIQNDLYPLSCPEILDLENKIEYLDFKEIYSL
ncbi:ribonuclease Oy-like [Microplitis demolitor]|uniref:ribonuclease Oy-like n=1 Tax=Microplitis demolitor TaxID=69319 RepID=UPI00235B682F|nr:ribonuclease Oy-like [Microplitis demolitor]